MKLAEMLAYADIRQLSQIAKHYQCACSMHSKHELIQSILTAINQKEVFEQTLRSLKLEERRFLNTLLFDKRDSFSLEELLAWARKTRFSGKQELQMGTSFVLGPLVEVKAANSSKQSWSPRNTIMNFTRRGWLFQGHSHQTKYMFMVPDDLKVRITQGIAKQLQKTVDVCEAPTIYKEEYDSLLCDIKSFLHYVHHHDIPLTKDGYIYKRQLQHILESFQIIEQLVQREAWRFGYGRKFKEYPIRFSFIYDYCYFHGFVIEETDRLLLSDEGHRVLTNGSIGNTMDLYRFWIRLYKGAIHNVQALAYWISMLTTEWATVSSLEQTLTPYIKPYYYDTPASILKKRMITMLVHFGLLRCGHHEKEGDVVQITPLGRNVIQGTNMDERDYIKWSEDKPAQ